MRSTWIVGLALALALSLTQRAAASDKSQLIVELIDLLPLEQTNEQVLFGVSMQLRQQLQSQGNVPPDAVNKIVAVLEDILAVEAEDLQALTIEQTALELDQIYSEEDLRNLLAFYRSETGQKALTAMPGVMQRTAVVVQKYFAERMPVIMAEFRRRLQEDGLMH